MPGLELDEVNNEIRFRYVTFGKMSQPDYMGMSTIVGMILLFVELFSDSLEQVVLGKASTNELLEKALFAMSTVGGGIYPK